MVKIFATGVTGYVGGDAIYAIVTAHPEYSVSCLVRDKDKAAAVAQAHPYVTLVYGDLNDSELLESEASKADIICHMADAIHESSTQALLRGLQQRPSSQPGYFIHTTLSGFLLYHDVVNGKYGESTNHIYDDLEGLSEVVNLPDFAKARGAEKAVRKAASEHATQVKTATVCLSTVYGLGRGLRRYRSVSINDLARSTLQRGHGIRVNEGKAAWGHIYIRDLSDLYLKLVENASSTRSQYQSKSSDNSALWGPEGFYFTENGEHIWGEAAQWIATEAKARGFLETDLVKPVSPAEAAELAPRAQFLWGCNSRSRAKRAKQLLNWHPTGPSLRDEIASIVSAEAVKLGLTEKSVGFDISAIELRGHS